MAFGKTSAATATTQVIIPLTDRRGKKPVKFKMSVEIPAFLDLIVHVSGDDLMVNRFGPTAMNALERKQTGEPMGKRAPKDPVAQYEEAKILDEEGNHCLTGEAFRKSFSEAAVTMDNVAKAELHREMVVTSALIPLKYEAEFMSRHRVVINRSGTDLRYRPQYRKWSCEVPVRMLLNSLTLEKMHAIFCRAGMMIGVGEWRPGSKKGGRFGTYRVNDVDVVGGNVSIAQARKVAAKAS